MKLYKTILLFILLILPYTINSLWLNENDYICMSNLKNKYDLVFPQNSSGQFDFCGTTTNTDILCGIDGTVYQINYLKNIFTVGWWRDNALLITDFICLPSLTKLVIDGFKISDSFLFYEYPQLTEIKYINMKVMNEITDVLPAYNLITFDSPILEGSVFNLKYISNKTSELHIVNSYVELQVDPNHLESNATQLFVLNCTVKNIPNLSNYQFQMVGLSLNQVFQLNTLSNFSTINAKEIRLYDTFPALSGLKLPSEFLSNISSVATVVMISHNLNAPLNGLVIDMSSNSGLLKLNLTNVGPLFKSSLQNNKFPIKVSSNTSVSISNGDYPAIDPIEQFGSAKGVSLINSNISNELFKFVGSSVEFFSFEGNDITGTIDSTWSDCELNVANNRMTGTIPTFYTCYFSMVDVIPNSINNFPRMVDRFKGNSFTTPLDPATPCTTFKPQVTVKDENTIIVTGQDIGFTTFYWKIDRVLSFSSSKTIKAGKEYECTMAEELKYFKGREYFGIAFIFPIDGIFIFPTSKTTPPYIQSVTIFGNSLSDNISRFRIDGTHYSSYYGQSVQNIKVGIVQYNIDKNSTFFSISSTTVHLLPTSTRELLTVTTNNMISKVLINTMDGVVNNKLCSDDCSNRGLCDIYIGECICNAGYTGAGDCFSHLCPTNILGVDCSSFGICNYTNGECNCDSNHYGADCSSFAIPCSFDCGTPLKHGTCNKATGECSCVGGKWSGDDCSIMVHFISSIEETNENGGEAIIIGGFGDVHKDISVTIGGEICNVTFTNSTVIKCTALPGTGSKIVTLYQNNLESKYVYNYRPINLPCLKNCTSPSHGICNSVTGICKCLANYISHDCSILNNGGNGNGGNTTIDEGTGSTNITDKSINFQIYFNSLKEVDINNNIIKQYPLLNNWSFNKSDSNIYTSQQSIGSDGICIVKSVIEEIIEKQGKEFTFAGTTFNIEQGSIKFTISIANYSYSSNLNTLQLEMISSVDQIQTTIMIIVIPKKLKLILQIFINKVISDGRPTFFSTTVTNNTNSIIITLSLPHCIDECVLDPDFSVLVSSDFKSECNDQSNNRKWVIPVAIVVSVVGAATIIMGTILVYKKSTALKVLIHASKLKKLNKLNK